MTRILLGLDLLNGKLDRWKSEARCLKKAECALVMVQKGASTTEASLIRERNLVKTLRLQLEAQRDRNTELHE